MMRQSSHRIQSSLAWVLLFVVKTGCCADNSQECNGSDGEDGQCLSPEQFDNDDDDDVEASCTVYIAPSSIPGAGLGMFTGVDLKQGDIVGYGDVIVPIVDFIYHMSADYKFKVESHFDPMANYVWDGREMGLQYETAFTITGISSFSPGYNCAVNCHLGLLNVDKTPPSYDTYGLHRSKDPGTGAFSPYHDARNVATENVAAGGELFTNYGNEYFTSRRALELVPIWEDYPQAKEFVDLFNAMWDSNLTDLSVNLMSDLWTLIHQFPVRSRFFNALPKNMEEFEEVVTHGIRSILEPRFSRSVQFLEEHGRCADIIKSGPSTLPQAGRGGFTTRSIPKGEIITGSPLLWFPNGDYFRMFEGPWTEQDEPPNIANQTHWQILINYCWTHEESSLFLCPYGTGIQHINHNQPQANVRVEWAKNGVMGQVEDLLMKHPEEMFPIASPGLVFDFIATRDIEAGEELFLDYGDAWEEAWMKHVQGWNVNKTLSKDYQSARQWNIDNANATLRTVKEQESDPYPEHFAFRCLKEIGAYELSSEIASEFWDVRACGLPCTIQDRIATETGYNYTVQFLPDGAYESGLSAIGLGPDENGQLWWMETEGVPREAIRVVDAPYTTDLFLKEAFRFPIQIPDSLFPKAWRGFRTKGVP